MVNVGVVGLGFMGVTHLRAYLKIPGARVAAICDAARLPEDGDFSKISGNIATGQPLKLDMTGVRATRRFEDLLDDPAIHLVDLCVPTPDHAPLAIAALRAGKHVVCEKPLARTSAQAREIAAAAAEAKGFFLPAMCVRFWPEYAWLRGRIVSGEFGRVRAARFRRVAEPPGWSADFMNGARSGGALLDLHIHDVDFIQYCFGRPVSVFAAGFSALSGAVDYVVATYAVEGGATVSAEGGWAMTRGFGFRAEFTVQFERATADFDSGRGPDALRLYEEGCAPRTISCAGPDGYHAELAHMIEAIESGRPPTVVTVRDAVSAIEICEAEEQSIRSGRPVELRPA